MAERRSKKFDFNKKAEREITFELEGVDHRGRTQVYEFHCLPDLSAAAASEFSRLQSEEQWVGAVVEFIAALLVEEDVTKWRRVIANKRINITPDELLEIFSWLNEQYGDRPTQPSNGSPVGRSTTDTGSTASSFSRGEG